VSSKIGKNWPTPRLISVKLQGTGGRKTSKGKTLATYKELRIRIFLNFSTATKKARRQENNSTK
jgi:hypothetical protein